MFWHKHSLDIPALQGKGRTRPRRIYRSRLALRRAFFHRGRQKRYAARRAARLQAIMVQRIAALNAVSKPLPGSRQPYDPELLYVECGRCGAPVIWEPGRATRILEVAGIDPLELDASCMLSTDSCSMCSKKKGYTVQIFRLSSGPGSQRPRSFGTA